MSNPLKSIANVIKKVIQSPIFKAVLIATAIYFTAGLAAGAMGVTAAVGLPGIAAAAETFGITAGAFATGATALTEAGVAVGALSGLNGIDALLGGSAMAEGGLDMATIAAGGAQAASAVGGLADIGESVSGSFGADAASGALPNAGMGVDAGSDLAGIADSGLMGPPSNLAPQGIDPVTGMNPSSITPGGIEEPGGINPTNVATTDVTPTTTAQAPAPASVTGQPTMQGIEDPGGINPTNTSTSTQGPIQKAANAVVQGAKDTWSWFKALSPEAKQILGQAGFGLAQAAMPNKAVNENSREFDALMEQRKIRNQPTVGGYNGIVNSMFSKPIQRPNFGG